MLMSILVVTKAFDCSMSQPSHRQTPFHLNFLTLQIKADKKGASFVRKATIGETLNHSAIVAFELVSLPRKIFARMQHTLSFLWWLAAPRLRERSL